MFKENFTKLLFMPLILAVLTNCGGSEAKKLIFSVQPTETVVGKAIGTITVQILDKAGKVVANADNSITIAIANNAGSGTLTGTLTVDAVAGAASFSDLSLNSVGTGYTLTATATDLTTATSSAFNITPVPAAKLTFGTQPTNAKSFNNLNPEVTVRIEDASGNLVTNANNTVTLSFGTNAGEVLLHTSGNGDRIAELIDPSFPHILNMLPFGSPDNEIIGMVYDSANDQIFASERSSQDFMRLDPTDARPTIFGSGTLDEIKGLAFNSDGSVLYGLPSSNTGGTANELYTINTGTGVLTPVGVMVPDTGSLDGFIGLSKDPTSGTYYAIAKLNGAGLSGRALMTVDFAGLTATLVGDTGDSVAAITFGKDGTLYGVTGDGASVSETLYTIDKATGTMTLLLSLGNGDDSENILMLPASLNGTVSVSAVNGIATFSNLQVNSVASGYTIEAAASGLTGATSDAFNITAPTIGGTVQFATTSQSVGEADGTVTVAVTVDAAQDHDIVIPIEVSGTATGFSSGSPDHGLRTDRRLLATIPAGATSADIKFGVFDDSNNEGSETVDLTIRDSFLASTLGANSLHTVTITDND